MGLSLRAAARRQGREALSATDEPSVDAGTSSVVLDLLEYYPNTRGDEVRYKKGATYLGVIERSSDGFTVLSLGGGTRAHNIQVGEVYAVTCRGVRHRLATPPERWRLRSAEIRRVVEGVVEDWARPYFDPASPQYFKSQPDYRLPTDDDAERSYRRKILGEPVPKRRARAEPEAPVRAGGCLVVFGVFLGISGLLATGAVVLQAAALT
jgi:hypothetical protein